MASIPLPALSVRPPEQGPDPIQQYGRLLALKGAVGQQQLQQQAITAGGQENQQRQMQLDDQKKLRQAFIDSEGDMDKFYNSATKAGVNPQTLIGVKSNLLEQKQKLATLTKDQLANYKSQTDAIGQATGSVLGLKPEERKAALLNTVIPNLAKQGVIPGDQAQALADQVNNSDDNGLEEMLKLHQFSAMAADKQIDEAFKSQTRPLELRKTTADVQSAEAEAGQKMRSNAASQLAAAFKNGPDAYAAARAELPYKIASQFPDKPASPDEILQGGMTPHEVATMPFEKDAAKQWLSENPGKSLTDYTVWKAQHSPTAIINNNSSITPEGIDFAADNYRRTGQLPAGLTRDPGATKQIISRAAQMDKAAGGAGLAMNKSDLEANRKSLDALQKSYDAVTAFEGTAQKNLDLFLNQAKQVVDSGSPIINKPLRAFSDVILGSPNMSAYKAARQVAVNEIAKVTSNPTLAGTLSDSARHEIDNFNPDNATLAQTFRVASILKQDMANRKNTLNSQIGDIKTRIKGKPSDQPTGGTQPLTIQLPSGKTVTIGGIQ